MFDFADLPTTYRWAIALWLAALGGCIGSFLNVVVYRLPAGKSLVRPGSHCPKCGHAIRWYDNVPVFGWLALRGKCRDCHEPISLRYPLVEAITAALFFGLGWIELLSDGANLPLDPTLVAKECPQPVIGSNEIIAVYVLHLLLLGTLLPAALIAYDQQPMPRMLFAPALLGGIFLPLVCPNLYPGRCCADTGMPIPLAWFILTLFDLVAGLVIGRVLGWVTPRSANDASGLGILLASVCVSLFLGAVVILLLGAVVLCVSLVGRGMVEDGRQSNPPPPMATPMIWLGLLVPVWIVFWRPLAAVIDGMLREIVMH